MVFLEFKNEFYLQFEDDDDETEVCRCRWIIDGDNLVGDLVSLFVLSHSTRIENYKIIRRDCRGLDLSDPYVIRTSDHVQIDAYNALPDIIREH